MGRQAQECTVMTNKKNAATLVLLGLTVVALYLCYLLFRPYARPALFAGVIAIVFQPLHRYVQRKIRNRNAGAFVSTLATFFLTAVPLSLLLVAITRELSDLYSSFAMKSARSGGLLNYLLQGLENIVSWVGRHFPIPSLDLHEIIRHRLEVASTGLLRFSAGVLGNLFSLLANSVIALFVLFFLYRDGEAALSKVMSLLPLPEHRLAELRTRVSSTIIANVYGGLAAGVAQGTIAGISFWLLGVDSPVLWGVVTAVVSLIPIVGSGLVWVPAAIGLLLTGHLWKGVILVALGAGAISTVDNLVRPLIVRQRMQLHILLVAFSLLGGLKLFGVLGLFIGPVILSVTAALLSMLQEDIAERSEPAPSEKIRMAESRKGAGP